MKCCKCGRGVPDDELRAENGKLTVTMCRRCAVKTAWWFKKRIVGPRFKSGYKRKLSFWKGKERFCLKVWGSYSAPFGVVSLMIWEVGTWNRC